MGSSPVTTLIIVCSIFTSLMVLAVAIRVYTKACILRSLGNDDCKYSPEILQDSHQLNLCKTLLWLQRYVLCSLSRYWSLSYGDQ